MRYCAKNQYFIITSLYHPISNLSHRSTNCISRINKIPFSRWRVEQKAEINQFKLGNIFLKRIYEGCSHLHDRIPHWKPTPNDLSILSVTNTAYDLSGWPRLDSAYTQKKRHQEQWNWTFSRLFNNRMLMKMQPYLRSGRFLRKSSHWGEIYIWQRKINVFVTPAGNRLVNFSMDAVLLLFSTIQPRFSILLFTGFARFQFSAGIKPFNILFKFSQNLWNWIDFSIGNLNLI